MLLPHGLPEWELLCTRGQSCHPRTSRGGRDDPSWGGYPAGLHHDRGASAPQDVGTHPPVPDVAAPKASQVYQEQIVTGETTHNKVVEKTVDIPQWQTVEKIAEIHETSRTGPDPSIDHVAPAPAVHRTAPASVVEHSAPASDAVWAKSRIGAGTCQPRETRRNRRTWEPPTIECSTSFGTVGGGWVGGGGGGGDACVCGRGGEEGARKEEG